MATVEINPFATDSDNASVTAISVEVDENWFYVKAPKFACQKPRKPFELKLAGTDATGREIWKVPTLVNTLYETTEANPFRFVLSVSRKASESARLELFKAGLAEGKNVIALKGDDLAEEIVLRPSTGGKSVKAKVRYFEPAQDTTPKARQKIA